MRTIDAITHLKGVTDFIDKRNTILLSVCMLFFLSAIKGYGQSNSNHAMVSIGALYERGFEATISYEHEGLYHNAWEYFGTVYTKYEDDPNAGHITKDSFWNGYNTWHLGIVYKPCISRGRNHHGNVRIGASGGSDLHKFKGGVHIGYEHSYALKHRWELFFQVKEDVIIKGEDLFRTGITFGVKVPL